MGKNGKRTTDQHDTDQAVQPWWENISYEGFLKLACSTFKPTLFLKLTGNEFKLLTYLTFLRWRFAEQSGRLRLGHDYLVKGSGLSQGTVRRCMRSLAGKHFLKLLKIDRNNGNSYLIYTILLLSSSDQIDRTPKTSDQFDRTARSKRSHGGRSSRTTCDQIDQEDQIQTNQSDGAPRHVLQTTSEGGVEDRSSEQRAGEGVALAGDGYRSWSEEWRATLDAVDEKLAREKQEAERAAAEAKRAKAFFRNQVQEYTNAYKAGLLTRDQLHEKVKAVAAATGQQPIFTDPDKPNGKQVGSGGRSNLHARV